MDLSLKNNFPTTQKKKKKNSDKIDDPIYPFNMCFHDFLSMQILLVITFFFSRRLNHKEKKFYIVSNKLGLTPT